jgi:hypothetical protein
MHRSTRFLAVVLALSLMCGLVACGQDDEPDDPTDDAGVTDATGSDTEQSDAEGDTGEPDVEDTTDDVAEDADASTTDASEDASDEDTSSPFDLAVCLDPCESPADCGNDGDPLYNPEHYACQAGACVFQGCTNDTECEESLGAEYGCDDSRDRPSCIETCSSVSDCTKQDSLNDDDNYECDAGFCRFLGCNNDQECIDSRGEDFVCVSASEHPTSDVSVCANACSSVSDCGSPADLYGEDNYECLDGGCVWRGCNSSEECNGVVDRGLICR